MLVVLFLSDHFPCEQKDAMLAGVAGKHSSLFITRIFSIKYLLLQLLCSVSTWTFQKFVIANETLIRACPCCEIMFSSGFLFVCNFNRKRRKSRNLKRPRFTIFWLPVSFSHGMSPFDKGDRDTYLSYGQLTSFRGGGEGGIEPKRVYSTFLPEQKCMH